VRLAPLICFEDTLAPVADKAAKLKPDLFVTITNDGWYWSWYAEWGIRQHLNHAVFRCVEHDRPMIRCANTGISDLIDQDGQVVDRFRSDTGAEIDVAGIFARKFQYYPSHPTFYESWGDWIVLLSALISVILGIRFFLPVASQNES
jgi:apolipoprotein N-acyltransferase